MAIEFPSTFSTGALLSAWDLSLLRTNAIEIDRLSYINPVAFLSSPAYITANPSRNPKDAYPDAVNTTDSLRLWRGALRYRSGMTTCSFELKLTKQLSESLHVYINGTDKGNVSTNGSATINVDISTGYAAGDVLEVEVRRIGKTSASASSANGGNPDNYVVMDVYASPVTVPYSWPGVPTFGTSYSATQLNQMSLACQWLRDALYALPINPQIGYVWKGITHKPETWDLWHGSIQRNFTNDILRIDGNVTCNNQAEKINVLLNGSIVGGYPTSGTLSYGQSATFYLPISLSSVSVGSKAELKIQIVVTTGNPSGVQDVNSVYNLFYVGIQPDGSGYPVPTVPADFVRGGSIAQTTLTSNLNTICGVLSGVYSRITGNPNTYNRIRAMVRRPGWDDNQNRSYQSVYVPEFYNRTGSILRIKGKDVKLGWNGFKMSDDPTKPYVYTGFVREESICAQDKYEAKTIYEDAYKDLQPGTRFFVAGTDPLFAVEERS
jgi:hypothetical protein